jgi:hypothetical protein
MKTIGSSKYSFINSALALSSDSEADDAMDVDNAPTVDEGDDLKKYDLDNYDEDTKTTGSSYFITRVLAQRAV